MAHSTFPYLSDHQLISTLMGAEACTGLLFSIIIHRFWHHTSASVLKKLLYKIYGIEQTAGCSERVHQSCQRSGWPWKAPNIEPIRQLALVSRRISSTSHGHIITHLLQFNQSIDSWSRLFPRDPATKLERIEGQTPRNSEVHGPTHHTNRSGTRNKAYIA